MTDTIIDTGLDIALAGKSGERYTGKIYSDKNSSSTIAGRAIACLSNSSFDGTGWTHHVNSIYNIERVSDELEHYKNRDDISHLILIPYPTHDSGVTDKVDDLIRNYIHR